MFAMDAAHRALMASIFEADDSTDPFRTTRWEQNQLIDQLADEYRALKLHMAIERKEPDCDHMEMNLVLDLNRNALRNLCAQIGRSFEALNLDGRQHKQLWNGEEARADSSCKQAEKMMREIIVEEMGAALKAKK